MWPEDFRTILLKTRACGNRGMDEEELLEEELAYSEEVDLSGDDEDELFDGFGEDGSYGEENY